MTSKLSNILLFSLLLLVAVAFLGVAGGPVITFNIEHSSGEPSGEELNNEQPDILGTLIKQYTSKHKEQFEQEFESNLNYTSLEYFKCPSPQANCTSKKKSCVQTLLQGLLKYMVLLKYVEIEYPKNSIILGAKSFIPGVITQMKQLMKHPERTGLPTTEEPVPKCGAGITNEFQRKMTAHSILRSFNYFLIDSYRALDKIKIKIKMMSRRRAVLNPFYLKKIINKVLL